MKTQGLGLFLAALLGIGLVSGCGETTMRTGPLIGRVVPHTEGTAAGTEFPDVGFVDEQGVSHRLMSLYGDATIIVLTEQPCAPARCPLVERTSEFGGRITVVEITTPPGGCGAHKQCVRTRGNRGSHVVSLCDGAGLVRRALGPAASDAVFVLDRAGRVVASGQMDDFSWLRESAIDEAVAAHPGAAERYEEWLGFIPY